MTRAQNQQNMKIDPIYFQGNPLGDTEMIPFVAVAEDEEPTKDEVFGEIMPVMPLKNTVLFPGVIIPITVGRDKSMKAILKAHDKDRFIAVLTQLDSKTEDPGFGDLYKTGTIARIVKLLKMPDGSQTVILQGRKRFTLAEAIKEDPYLECKINLKDYVNASNKIEYDAMIKSLHEKSRNIIELSPQIPNEAQLLLRNINNDRFLLNFISSHLSIPIQEKQALLEMDKLDQKADKLITYLAAITRRHAVSRP